VAAGDARGPEACYVPAAMAYLVKELFYTLQGEGFHAGRAAVFCRFAGCNLWSGREADRAKAACSFCDTDFVGVDGDGGGRFETADHLADTIAAAFPGERSRRFVVFTGGEPLLQVDGPLTAALHARGFYIAVETNGTIAPEVDVSLDWICVSPKAHEPLKLTRGDELKLVHPQLGVDPARYLGLEFGSFRLQPLAGLGDAGADRSARSTAACVRYCLDHPQWQLSVQTHKVLGIP
jgi:7-carboxy-7-deazaguanine synthase